MNENVNTHSSTPARPSFHHMPSISRTPAHHPDPTIIVHRDRRQERRLMPLTPPHIPLTHNARLTLPLGLFQHLHIPLLALSDLRLAEAPRGLGGGFAVHGEDGVVVAGVGGSD